MPDLKISELPAATTLADTDIAPLVQSSPTATTRRASVSQVRRQVLVDRGVDVRDFGATGNGTSNDAPAIQAAINALGAAGGVVHLGARTYRLASAITVNGGAVRLQGQGFNDGGSPGTGTWLTVDQTGFTPITFTGTAARGSAVADIAVRQTHGATQVAGWAPTNYDWFFRVQNCLGGVAFDNILLSGVNRGILVRNSGRTDIWRLRGQVFTAGIEMDEIYDTARIANLHFWPYWSANDFVVRWQQQNGDAMIFRRVDGVFVDQSFVLGYRTMFRFSSSTAGFTQKFSIGQAYADFVRHGLLIEANGTDGQVDSMTVQCELFNASGATLPGSIGVHVTAANTRVQVGALRVDDVEDTAIRIEQHSNRLDLGALRVVNYNQRNNGAAAIHLANATTGTPNRVNLGSDPLLETATPGPLFNPGSNGATGILAPAGELARPGLAIGESGTGWHRSGMGHLAGGVAGSERIRAAPGFVTLGGPLGAHALEIAADAALVNRMLVQGGATGTPGRVGWSASGADANIDAVIGEPRGNGAVLAQFPDGASPGGAARGVHAVDLQTIRNSAAQVASGSVSVVGGGDRNTASGSRSIVAGGQQNSATQNFATVGGGNLNSASAASAAVGGGNNNAASGEAAAIGGGSQNAAGGGFSWLPGGLRGTTRGQFAMGAWAGGQFSTNGDAQGSERVLRAQTTNATATRLTADGAAAGGSNTVNLPANGTYRLKILVVAQQTAGTAGAAGDCASWSVEATVKRGATVAATTYVGGVTLNHTPAAAAAASGAALTPGHRDAAAAAWTIALAADTTNGGLAVTATGEANKTIRWVARVSGVEVSA